MEEVIGHLAASGADPLDVVPVLPALVQILGAESLLPILADAVPQLRAHEHCGPVAGLLRSEGDPTLTATMALCQRAQRGDWNACAELRRLQRLNPDLTSAACATLLRLQHGKMKNRSV